MSSKKVKLMSNSLLHKKILAIDYGTTITGFASFHVGIDPFILLHGQIKFQNNAHLIKTIKQYIQDDFFDLIVLGIPYQENGGLSKMTEKILDFAKLLESELSIPLYYQDESFSTQAAMDRMKSDPRFNFKVDLSKIDSVSASIILEDFLQGWPK